MNDDSLREQIAGCERAMAELDEKARLRGGMVAEMQIKRDGIEACLEQLRSELRFERGEPEPVRH